MNENSERRLMNYLANVDRNVNELIWANVYHDASRGCEWFPKEGLVINPGRWAVGYNYFYVVFRVLNETKPRSILELGAGQSSRLIGQYVKTRENADEVEHIIVEHDGNFARTLQRDFQFSPATKFFIAPLTRKKVRVNNSDGECYAYDEKVFGEAIGDRKFDFISIDGPYGFGGKTFARIDLLAHLPRCLSESFCLVIDDFNREGEQNTARLIRNVLDQNHIAYSQHVYSGSKDMYLLASADRSWLCSM